MRMGIFQNHPSNHKAFSLIELMITVALVGILSATAIPSYLKYLSDAKNAEAAIILADAGKEQERIYVMSGDYTDVLHTEEDGKMAISTRFANPSFNLIVGGTVQLGPTDISRFDEISASMTPAQNTGIFGRGTTTATGEKVFVMAVERNGDSDNHLTVIGMNKHRQLAVLCDDFSNLDAATSTWEDFSGVGGGTATTNLDTPPSCIHNIIPGGGYGSPP